MMQKLARLSLSQQTSEHLREGFRTGRWGPTLPGIARLAEKLDVSPPTVRTAVKQLENEGLLVPQGPGRNRKITNVKDFQRGLRVGILPHDPPINGSIQTDNLVHEIQHTLEASGHMVFFNKKSQVELHHNVQRMTNQIAKHNADAWIVSAGSSELLKWFANQSAPCMALFGRKGNLSIASTGPDKLPAFLSATRHLVSMGHRRIVFITPEPNRRPNPARVPRAFLNELTAHGIPTGEFNLPDWKETPEGFANLLQELFRSTPPTAMIIDEVPKVIAAMQFLLQRGIKVPEQVSLVSTDHDRLGWCHPGIAHIKWDAAKISTHILRWIRAVEKGKDHRKTIYIPAEFIPGGSIGAAPSKK
jgi:DNA-binding LacI/PurR family transcriptional regulator